MDFTVEATVDLQFFPDKSQVKQILRSKDFTLTDLGSDRVRVKGTFFKLKEAKDSLDRLLSSRDPVTPSSASLVQDCSSGAISKHSNKSEHRSPSAPIRNSSTLHESRSYSSPHSGQRGSVRSGKESFFVEADVFEYAKKLKGKDMKDILEEHRVTMDVCQADESFTVTLNGKYSSEAAKKLKHFLNELHRSLRTQEVRLEDMDHKGIALLRNIQKDRNSSVLVREVGDKLQVIGSSHESYKVKQKLLEKAQEPPVQTRQILDKPPISRSNAVPPRSQNTTARHNHSASWWNCWVPSLHNHGAKKEKTKQGAIS